MGTQRGHCNDVRALGVNFDNRRVVLFSDAQFARGSFARVNQASVNRTDNTACNATVSRCYRSNSNGCYVVYACNRFSRLPVFHIRTWHRCLSVQKNSVLAALWYIFVSQLQRRYRFMWHSSLLSSHGMQKYLIDAIWYNPTSLVCDSFTHIVTTRTPCLTLQPNAAHRIALRLTNIACRKSGYVDMAE